MQERSIRLRIFPRCVYGYLTPENDMDFIFWISLKENMHGHYDSIIQQGFLYSETSTRKGKFMKFKEMDKMLETTLQEIDKEIKRRLIEEVL